jgi:hypothetical protein
MYIDKHSGISKFFLNIAPWLIGIAGIMIVIGLYQENVTQYKVVETSAYTRVTNCIVAKNGYQQIKQLDVEKCYQQVEKESHIKLERFDTQTQTQPTNN